MLRHIFALIVVIFGSLITTAAVAAPTVPFGPSSKMVFVTDTGLVDTDGSPLSMCSLWSRQHILYVGYFGTQKYVLAQNQCDAAQYYDYAPATLLEDRVQGLIPVTVLNEPELSVGFAIYSFSAWVVALLIFLIWANGAVTASAKKRRQRKLLGDVHPYVARMITVMTHAARSDGKISDVEIDLMMRTIKQNTKVNIEVQDLLRVINMTPKIKSDAEFKNLGRGLDEQGRQNMFHAGVAMISADGVLEKSERKWLSRLGTGLGYKKRELVEIFAELDRDDLAGA